VGGQRPALALSLAVVVAAAASSGVGAAVTPAATAQRICLRIQAHVGKATYLRAYPVASACRVSMGSTATTANRACLRRGENGSAPWSACVAVKVAAAARVQERFIALRFPPTTTTTTAAAAQPPVTTQPGPLDVVGTITFLTPTSLSVGLVTCALDASSPSLAAFKLGSPADMLCQDGVVRRVSTPPP
jgi:hypothetical protein